MSMNMRRSKSQAVYKFLPGMWVASRGDGFSVTAEVRGWNYRRMDDVYQHFVEGEIKRQIRLFGARGGDVSSFVIDGGTNCFTIVEPAMNETAEDIVGYKSPLVFYCNSCHEVVQYKKTDDIDHQKWKCPNCKSNLKQLQMVYACECGHAEPVKIPYVQGGYKKMKYLPNENSFRMIAVTDTGEKKAELSIPCPNCKSRLYPDNAESTRNYKPFSLKIINIADKKNGDFFERGLEAQKVLVSKWFDKLSHNQFVKILSNLELAFSEETTSDAKRKEAEVVVQTMINNGLVPETQREAMISTMLSATQENTLSVEPYVNACDQLFAKMRKENEEEYNAWIENLAYKLMQYNTIKYAPKVLSLEDSISKQLAMDFIDDESDILDLNKKMGIKSVQVSCDIEIINCTYGFTRRVSDPAQAKNNKTLKLVAYDRYRKDNSYLVYGAKLETEGILFEIDRVKILEWLQMNEVISDEQMPDIDDEESVKLWFAENVHSDKINIFSGADSEDEVTKNVFGLLHSMSHSFMKIAGEISGLEDTSLTEVVLLETTSIFIYAQTSQGTPLGALSGMVETNYYNFLQKAISETKNCIFDPICNDRDDTSCSACIVLPEICCEFFNHDLGRKYMYTLKENKKTNKPIIGFWEI